MCVFLRFVLCKSQLNAHSCCLRLFVGCYPSNRAFTVASVTLCATLCVCIFLSMSPFPPLSQTAAVQCPTSGGTDGGFANVEALPCDDSSLLQQWSMTSTGDGSQRITLTFNPSLCLTVSGCAAKDCSNVVVTDCGMQACGNFGQQWVLQQPPRPDPAHPTATWFTPSAAPAFCMEIPLGGPNVDVYDCDPGYPQPILHEIWRFNASSGAIVSSTGQCLAAVKPPKPVPVPPVWPFPTGAVEVGAASTAVSSGFAFVFAGNSPTARLSARGQYYASVIQRYAASDAVTAVSTCVVSVRSGATTLNVSTDYSYDLRINGSASCTIFAATIYGACECFSVCGFSCLRVECHAPHRRNVRNGDPYAAGAASHWRASAHQHH